MTAFHVYGFGAAALIGIGVIGLMVRTHVLRKLMALNIVGGGVFMLFIALAQRSTVDGVDPVPHALVLTGIVVTVSATALAVALIRRLTANGAPPVLPEEQPAPPDDVSRSER
ncbi:MAG: NADH-quinone oxidoreductase subunit K [Gammaproteobacteria bacterium]